MRGVFGRAVLLIASASLGGAGCGSSSAKQAAQDAGVDGDTGAGDGGVSDAVRDGGVDRLPVPATDVFFPGADVCGRSRIPNLPPNQILDTGAVGFVRVLRYEGDRVFTGGEDPAGRSDRWMLWSVSQRTQIAAGAFTRTTTNGTLPFTDMRGGLLVTRASTGEYELRSADDGRVTATVNATESVSRGLAPDGSYFWALGPSGLVAWSPAGAVLVNDPTVAADTFVVASAGHLLFVPASGTDARIETLDVPGGAVHLSDPLPAGTDFKWLSDGLHVSMRAAGTALIYDTAGKVVASRVGVSVDDGYGDYVWRFDLNAHLLTVMSISGGLASVGTYNASQVQALGHGRLGMDVADSPGGTDPMTGAIAVLDFNQPTLNTAYIRYEKNIGDSGFNEPPAFSGDGRYVYVATHGTVWTDDGRNLGCGSALAYAGGDDGTLAVATEVGVLVLRLAEQMTATLEGRFAVTGEALEMTGDGRLLAVRQNWLYGAQMVSVVSVESHTLLHTWGRADAVGPGGPGLPDPDFVVDFSLARHADRVATSFVTQASYSAPVIHHVYLSDSRGANAQEVSGAPLGLRLSPDGTHLLAQSGDGATGISIYAGSTLVGAPVGTASSWWDDSRYVTRVTGTMPTLYDLAGVESTGVTLPARVDDAAILFHYGHQPLVQLANGRIYSAAGNAILDQSTGAAVTSGSGVWLVAAAGPYVVKTLEHARLSIERY
jgi:hypothetical protein